MDVPEMEKLAKVLVGEHDPDPVVLRLFAPCNGSRTHSWANQYKDRITDKVILKAIFLKGIDTIDFNDDGSEGRLFVPSFDKKEEGIYICSWAQDEPDKPKIKLTCSYDSNTMTLTTAGEGFAHIYIDINLK